MEKSQQNICINSKSNARHVMPLMNYVSGIACSLQQALDHRNSRLCASGHDAYRYPSCSPGISSGQTDPPHLPP